jgi:hypothetical protein
MLAYPSACLRLIEVAHRGKGGAKNVLKINNLYWETQTSASNCGLNPLLSLANVRNSASNSVGKIHSIDSERYFAISDGSRSTALNIMMINHYRATFLLARYCRKRLTLH